MDRKSKYISTAEACERLQVYNAYLWSMVGRKLSPPRRIGPKQTFWLRAEVDAVALELAVLRKAVQ